MKTAHSFLTWKILPFESKCLGIPSARLALETHDDVDDDRFSSAIIHAKENWRHAGIRFVVCRIPIEHANTAAALCSAGFIAIETLVTLRRPILAVDIPRIPKFRVADRPDDCAQAVRIAGCAFLNDRFHRDTRLPRKKANILKKEWVKGGFAGRADKSFVTEMADGRISGFLQCRHDGSEAVIDLIAVDPLEQGRGVGKNLVTGALRYYAGTMKSMRVGTQETNEASLALYERLGFQVSTHAVTFHWLEDQCP